MGADTGLVRLRTPTTDLIERAFAEAVAAGEPEAAEGWLTLALQVRERWSGVRRAEPDVSHPLGHESQPAA